MGESKAFKYASKKATSWSKLSLPGWWGVFQWVCAAILAVILIGGLFQSPSSDIAAGPPSFEDTGEFPTPGEPPAPNEPAPADPESPTEPAPTTDTPSLDGEVPAEARALAEQGLKAFFDSSIARSTYVVGGGTMTTPARDFPDGTVEDLTFTGESDGHYSFSALVDADGPGDEFGPAVMGITVTKEDDIWKVVQ